MKNEVEEEGSFPSTVTESPSEVIRSSAARGDAVAEGASDRVEGDDLQDAGAAEAAARAAAEHDALVHVFDDVRSQSSQSELVEPSRWVDLDFVPEHMTADEFEMFVYEYLEEWRAEHADDEAVPTPVFRSATRAVGVPHFFDKPEPEEEKTGGLSEGEVAERSDDSSVGNEVPTYATQPGLEDVSQGLEAAAPPAGDDAIETGEEGPFSHLKIPEGFELVELEGEYVMVPLEEPLQQVEQPIVCDRIETLVGARSYYLYSSDVMTDAYAHWAYLAAEDDKIITFVDCVREDSRVYPRPLAASNLKNPPFGFDDAVIREAWDTVRESGIYPDIEQTIASNGDVYYYSTRYLKPAHAVSLAEWDAVERKMHL